MRRISRKWYVALLTFLAGSLVVLLVLGTIEHIEYRHNRERMNAAAQAAAQRLQVSTFHLLQTTKLVAELVRLNPQDISWFPRVSAELRDDVSIMSLQLVRNGQVVAAYPDGYRTWLSRDNNASRALQAAKERSLVNGELTAFGPFPYFNKENALLGVYPIYLYNGKSGFNTWGLSTILLRVPLALKSMDFQSLEAAGCAYRVRSLNDDNGQVLAASAADVGSNPVIQSVTVPNGQWILEMAPAHGWFNWHGILTEMAVGEFLVLLLAVLVFSFLKLREQSEYMRMQAVTDPLTQLSNRHILMEELTERCCDPKGHFLLCYMDLNGFKEVNDTRGHDTGDDLLQAVSHRLRSCIKPEDELFRMGGDEFIAILEPESTDGWKERIEAIEIELRRMFVIHEDCIEISVSIGCAVYPQTAADAESLLKVADQRMMENKERFARA